MTTRCLREKTLSFFRRTLKRFLEQSVDRHFQKHERGAANPEARAPARTTHCATTHQDKRTNTLLGQHLFPFDRREEKPNRERCRSRERIEETANNARTRCTDYEDESPSRVNILYLLALVGRTHAVRFLRNSNKGRDTRNLFT